MGSAPVVRRRNDEEVSRTSHDVKRTRLTASPGVLKLRQRLRRKSLEKDSVDDCTDSVMHSTEISQNEDSVSESGTQVATKRFKYLRRVCEPPGACFLECATDTSISLKWRPPPPGDGDDAPVAKSFELQMKGIRESPKIVYAGGAWNCTVQNLTPSRVYCFRVAAIDTDGCRGPFCVSICCWCFRERVDSLF